MTHNKIRIGTRDSKLAVWQAEWVATQLLESGIGSELVYIKTEGDLVLDTPLPLMGGKGVFTKALDDALLNGSIDIAVHSFKDIPTVLPDGIQIAAVCERHDVRDALVVRTNADFYDKQDYAGIIATSSTRRKAQWLRRYPLFSISDIRGNVQTRLRKLSESNWDAAIFASAGLERLGLENKIAVKLDWMVPAPAQGAVAVTALTSNKEVLESLNVIHHEATFTSTQIEREFLNVLEAGCSAPVGALVTIDETGIEGFFHGIVLSSDGKEAIEISEKFSVNNSLHFGKKMAEKALEKGASALLVQG
ncbi:hydroxymethylbilane synthase [bacterium]|nr:MAG: hydroxymethylbilane synthase [bacterium]